MTLISPQDQSPLSVPCPHCGKEVQKTVGWLKRNKIFICTCGAKSDLQNEDCVQVLKNTFKK